MTAVTEAGMSTRAIGSAIGIASDRPRGSYRAWRAVEPWHVALSLALLFVVLAVWLALHDAPAAAVVCGMCTGWTGSTCWIGRALR